ncbi:MAG: YtxH domain-containing protein [Candidatus Pristimantibacillus lignocellulolyticus]|uniref:YtxH domain-containing protein n=1 Tax=Candidatus Pristimantibacillus lignocellulolyticus TaxID=2994561 RepID=A0A9J6ZFR5_9BACL|nr:MAG: YtxH domain-containing protein [Candidatus Pristimantibacillus lignocellulolyticus]
MPNETRSSGILLGTVIGGTMGIIATLLLAPKSGAKMREELSDKYHSLCDRTKEIASTVGEKTKEIASTVGGTTKDIVESVKEEASSLADQAKESKQNIKDSFASTTDELKDKLSATDK